MSEAIRGRGPARKVEMAECVATVERRPDGVLVVRNTAAPDPWPEKLTQRLDYWAEQAPDRVWLAERESGGGWARVTYSQARMRVRRIAAALLKRNLSPDRPIIILSDNSVDHALLGMAAQYAGIPYAPVSPAYSLVSTDHSKLRYIFDLLTPGLVFIEDAAPFARAIASAIPHDVEIVVSRHPPAGRAVTDFAELAGAEPDDAAVDAAHAKVGPDTVAKFLFTSGSTGMPKAVINTQLMLTCNMAMCSRHFAYLLDEPPVTLDWSPWNHTAGGNHDFNLFLYTGGSFYIDDGKPTPGGIEATVRNLRDVSPTWYFNVPKGYDALIPYLRADPALCESFFGRLKLFWYAGAGMAQHIWDALDELSLRTCGERILVLTGLGSTETAPFAMAANQTMVGAGNIGVPARGVELKLVPSDGKYEARFRGPNITPGYWRQPELTAKAYDEEGFYKIGDALKFIDPHDVNRGFMFDGRIAEDFKLATGTWVAVGPLRVGFIDHFAPYVQDMVLAGLNRDFLTALVFPNVSACRELAGAPNATVREALDHPKVVAEMQRLLRELAQRSTGSSTRIERMILMDEGPSIDRGEMTDKGSINQRAVLSHREPLVELLYEKTPRGHVISAR